MPELHPQTRCFAIRAQQCHGAIRAAAALRVGDAPELRHAPQRPDQHRPEGLGATGVANRLLQRARQALIPWACRPASCLGFVLVVGGSELGDQWAFCSGVLSGLS